jgi:hypothetical protein
MFMYKVRIASLSFVGLQEKGRYWKTFVFETKMIEKHIAWETWMLEMIADKTLMK